MRCELPRVLVPASAAELGISRARVRTEVRRGNWRVIARGAVLTRDEAPTRDDWAALGIALGGPSAALSGWDAARAVGLGEPHPPSEHVLVLSRHATNRVVGGVRIRETARPYSVRTTSADNVVHPLTPIVGTARAISDAAAYFDAANPVRALVTSAIQRKRCTVEQLVAELHARPRNGSRFLRLALRDAVDGARSVAEAAASRRMTRARIPAFELNVPIIDAAGRVIAIADVLWRSLRAILEIDSREYHLSEADWKGTMRRHNLLTRLSFALTHVAPSDVTGRGEGWLGELGCWLSGRSLELGIPLPAGRGVVSPVGGEPQPYYLTSR
jgi:hypothetical protein